MDRRLWILALQLDWIGIRQIYYRLTFRPEKARELINQSLRLYVEAHNIHSEKRNG